jgi:hypothetical protein
MFWASVTAFGMTVALGLAQVVTFTRDRRPRSYVETVALTLGLVVFGLCKELDSARQAAGGDPHRKASWVYVGLFIFVGAYALATAIWLR